MPGDPDSSRIVAAVRYDGELQMPPKGKLPGPEIDALTRWVGMGAPWPEFSAAGSASASSVGSKPANSTASQSRPGRDHWAFRPVKPPVVPGVMDGAWAQGPIDRFVLARLEGKGLKPVEPADRRTWLRRVTFDLVGLPPTVAEIDAFLADDSTLAFERVVDRLLASPRYGERWGRHWLDVARYAEDQAHTFQAKLYTYGYRYRDWVIQALNADMPYDGFVKEQIAGDLIDGPNRESRLAALGFFALGPVYYGGAIADERDDRIDTLSRGFLGLTVACARCHDHKYDPIPTRDYYSLAGVFASTVAKDVPTAPAADVERYDKAQASIKTKTAELAAAKKKTPVDKDRVKALSAELDRLKKESPAPYPVIHAVADAKSPVTLRVAIRGNAENPGEEAPRAFLGVLCPSDPTPFRDGSGRRELAEAVASRDNPLTARVIVNRLWEHHFGRGLVGTPSNFGALGEPPTHPELLDYLAARLVDQGWSLKSLHREIVLSASYRLSSRIEPSAHAVDPDNLLIWRMNRRRLEVEAWRDAMLAVSGALDPTIGGPSQDLTDSANRRRTLYAKVSRHSLDGLLRLFDFPDPNLTCDRRVATSVPLQQLFVLNSEFMVRQARALAERLSAEGGVDDAAQVRRAFPLLYGREADDDEVRWGVEYLAAGAVGSGGPAGTMTAWEQYAQALLGSNEFAFVD
jgi:hypothetical protein